jgi:hypothetical protein
MSFDKTIILSGSRAGLSSVAITDVATSKTQAVVNASFSLAPAPGTTISRVGGQAIIPTVPGYGALAISESTSGALPGIFLDATFLILATGAMHADGVASVAFTGSEGALGAAQMDGLALVQWTSGIVERGAAEMDGAASASFVGGYVVRGQMNADGSTDVEFITQPMAIGAAQMDGLTSVNVHGAVASGAMHADGLATVAWTGRVTGGFYIGTAQMDGVGQAIFGGVASIIITASAEMDGQGSMLGVVEGPPLPPHGIILAAGM